MDEHGHKSGWAGPKSWVVSVAAGVLVGIALIWFTSPGTYVEEHAPTANHEHHEDEHTDLPHSDSIEVASFENGETGIMVPPLEHDEHADDDHAHESGHDDAHAEHGPSPTIPIWLCLPFAALLLSIAVMPFINERVWHNHFPDFAFFFGAIITAYYLFGYDQPGYAGALSYGQYKMLHAGLEYYAFIALIGGLFVASGGILIDVKGKGGPIMNTALLAFGAVAANIVGTTGASVLLIRPFMRLNEGRLKPIHVVLFIFIVSNCGGCLTPIGDPPLYLGYLKGVPFEWTLIHLWPMWAACVGMLLAIFFVIDMKIGPRRNEQGEVVLDNGVRTSIKISGMSGIICLTLIIAGVFIDPMIKKLGGVEHPPPVGPTFQILVAIAAYLTANKANQKANDFTFFPVKEVGLLFIGIFATMTPALGFLSANSSSLGLDSPSAFYFGTGVLSGVLDNAPTYLNFLQVAFGEQELNADNIHAFIAEPSGSSLLMAISLGAVFFGAMTYIGNGPNFMVKAIAESSGVNMPSFFGYHVRAIVLLVPVLVVIWVLFIR